MTNIHSEPRRSDIHPAIRYGVAFIVGAVAVVFGIGARGGDFGMFAIVAIPIMIGIVSAVSVLLCALLGRCLQIPSLARRGLVGVWTAFCVLAIGLVFFLFGIGSKLIAPGSIPEDPTYLLGWSYWPGYLLLVLGAANFPYESIVTKFSS